ncbi:MAG TPA: hypothetical protein VGS07_00710 [Thermoanaerobaculia bacterium]|jgi:hypothetical protein|nr:hypothetical protein [Thermoanaerobaculia bacterium]
MKRTLFGCLTLLATLAIALPATAGNLYIPLLDRDGVGASHQRTEVWIANPASQSHNFKPVFLPTGTSGTPLSGTGTTTTVLSGRTSKLIGLTSPGQLGLLEIAADTDLQVEARLANTLGAGSSTYTQVPVITSANVVPAGSKANLLGLGRSSSGIYTDLGVVNLDRQAATTCAVSVFRADGTQVAGTATITVEALSMRHFGDALGLLGETDLLDARAQVTCDKAFYPYAAVFNPVAGVLLFATPTGSGASTLGGSTPPPAGNSVIFTLNGLFHTPTLGHEIKQLVVQVPHALSLRSMIVDWDITPAAFTAGHEAENHSLIWIYRGKNRSNTIANMNAFGPARSTVKNNSNVDLAPPAVTTKETSMAFQQGTLYHIHYVYDAEHETITTTVSTGGVTTATMTQNATAKLNILTIPAVGFNVQFGNTAAQATSGEWPTYGWQYANLRIEMVPY